MGYILLTRNNHNMYDMASMLQKAIRRNNIRLAGYAAMELFGNYHQYLWRRLIVISAEDCYGIMTKEIIALKFADDEVNKGRKGYDKDCIFVAKAVTLLCMAKKNRDGCYVACNFMLPDKILDPKEIEHADVFDIRRLEDSELPEWVFDCHTLKGKMLGKDDVDMCIEEEKALEPKQMSFFDDCGWQDFYENEIEKGNLSKTAQEKYERLLKNKRRPE